LRGPEEARGGLLRTCLQYCLSHPCGDNLEDAEFCADTLKMRQRVDAAAEECEVLRIVAEDVGKVRCCAWSSQRPLIRVMGGDILMLARCKGTLLSQARLCAVRWGSLLERLVYERKGTLEYLAQKYAGSFGGDLT
jgi:hypothetical protein